MPHPRFAACVFDAYGTRFDVGSIASAAERLVPSHGADLGKLWRAKQLEYTWLASLMAAPGYARPDFRDVTAMALDYAVAALVLPIGADARAELAAGYLRLATYPDAHASLASLAPLPRWILSNGTRDMLDLLVADSTRADGVIRSTKPGLLPAPRVYALAVERLGVAPRSIAFVSANAWDAAAAQAVGFTALWINRAGTPIERHAAPPAFIVGSLSEVAAIVNDAG
jgi:2-haloacid dehalogenase